MTETVNCLACGHAETVGAEDTLLWCSECGGTFPIPREAPEPPSTYPDYDAMRDELARVLCVERRDGGKPCPACCDAANRIVVKRRPIRRLLIAFARAQAGLGEDA